MLILDKIFEFYLKHVVDTLRKLNKMSIFYLKVNYLQLSYFYIISFCCSIAIKKKSITVKLYQFRSVSVDFNFKIVKVNNISVKFLEQKSKI